mgnify:CR=1 FL=1
MFKIKIGLAVVCISTLVLMDSCSDEIAEIQGCTDFSAINFNGDATVDDGSCEYGSIVDELVDCPLSVNFDSYVYTVVQIGNQCWFAENLRTATYSNGDQILSISELSDFENTGPGAEGVYSAYGHDADYCSFYDTGYPTEFDPCSGDSMTIENWGLLYNVHAVRDGRNICPSGFHVATPEDFDSLMDYINADETNLGLHTLVDGSDWGDEWTSNFSSFQDPYGFRLKPGGMFASSQNEDGWSSTHYYGFEGAGLWLVDDTELVRPYMKWWAIDGGSIYADPISPPLPSEYSNFHSVRCIRD